jgi:hypothetical protein
LYVPVLAELTLPSLAAIRGSPTGRIGPDEDIISLPVRPPKGQFLGDHVLEGMALTIASALFHSAIST